MLRGPRGAVEALYALQAEEATALRGEIRSVVAVLEAHNKRQDELLLLRQTADHQILATVEDLIKITGALKAVALSADSMPERVQSVLNSADITAIHKKLADALTVDIWAKLDASSDADSKRIEETFMRLERRVKRRGCKHPRRKSREAKRSNSCTARVSLRAHDESRAPRLHPYAACKCRRPQTRGHLRIRKCWPSRSRHVDSPTCADRGRQLELPLHILEARQTVTLIAA